MTARAPSESQSQQKLTWDNEGRLTAWQNAPTSPTSTDQYLYDGDGNRVEQQVTTSGTTTTTTYVGDIEQVVTTGGTTTTTTYYYAAGQRIALAVNGALSYLASDLLGSASVALDGTGIPTASQLYAPYGGTRYSNGTMPTDYGFTGQRADSAMGLDYYGARYYDPALGQFTSADTVIDGLNRYAYVAGNPETNIDPTGRMDKPSASDPYLKTMFDTLWRDTAFWGDKSSMWALMVLEAVDGRPTGGSWHYEKVWAAKNGLEGWIKRTCNSPSYLIACRNGTSGAIDADLATTWAVLLYIYKALHAWETSQYYTGREGENPPMPFISAQPLPAPSPGMPVQPALPPAHGIPAQPGALPPVPSIAPAHQMPPGFWQLEHWSAVRLPDVPGFAPTTIPGTAPSGPSFPVVPIPPIDILPGGEPSGAGGISSAGELPVAPVVGIGWGSGGSDDGFR
jgi:RHS repeat-associated protein